MSDYTLPTTDHPTAEVAADGTPEPTTRPASTRRISRLLVFAIVLAVGLLIGAVVLSQRADGQRRTALARQVAAAAGVDAGQTRSDAADRNYSARQLAASTLQTDDVAPLVTAQQATQLNDQASANAQQALAAGLAGSEHDYNATVDEGNKLVDQANGVIDQLSDQVDKLPSP